MAFRRSPVRSRSGPPSFAHARSRRSVSYGSASHAKDAAPERRSREGGPDRLRTSFGSARHPILLFSGGSLDSCGASRILQPLIATPIVEIVIDVVRTRRFFAFCLAAFRHSRCLRWGMQQIKRIVYVLKSASPKAHYYIGLTHDVHARLADHNAGRCRHTARYRPWRLHVTIELPDEQRGAAFERYLKSGSGRAFAKRHFD